MGKIEEIKGRVSLNALHQSEWSENYRGDVQYLLSRLEIAQKALQTIRNETDNLDEPNVFVMIKAAEEALEQIQKE